MPSQIFGSSDEVWFLLWWLILCKRLLIIIHCKVLLVSEINYLQSTYKERERNVRLTWSEESTPGVGSTWRIPTEPGLGKREKIAVQSRIL